MNINFEAIEKAWFKPKKDELNTKYILDELMNNSEKIDKAISIYLKELSEKGEVDDLACRMFNILEGNIK